MPRGGHNATPTPIRELRGNPGHRPMPTNTPQPKTVSRMSPPSWLDTMAKRHWQVVQPVLSGMGVLTEADIDALALYCQAFSRYRKVLKMMGDLDFDSQEFKGWESKDIAAVLGGLPIRLEKAEQSMRALGGDLGLNPTSRTRLSVSERKQTDPFEEFLHGGRNTG